MNNITLYSWESSEIIEGSRTSTAIAKIGPVKRQLTQKQVNLITTHRLNWSICCRAICEVNNDRWIETEIISVKDLKINDLAEHYEVMREQVLAAVNTKSILDLGWICQSYNKNNPIDSNYELKYLEPIDTYRKEAWQKLYASEKLEEV